VKSLQELIKYIKDDAGKITYGTTGDGSRSNWRRCCCADGRRLGKMTEVPYKGSSAAHPDLIANRISFMIDPLAAAGRTSRRGPCARWRSPRLSVTHHFGHPDGNRSGVPGYDSRVGRRVRARRHARAIVQKLNAEIGAALANPDLRKRFTDMGLVAKHSTPKSSANSCNRK